uniref:SPC3 n=1 Tax=Amphiprion ocellaris TaxID=80972 RepID=A0AAQ5YY62_AMPOC
PGGDLRCSTSDRLLVKAWLRFLALWMGTLLQFCHATIYTNDWAVKIGGDLESVDRIAEKYGFTNMGQIGDLKSYYSFRHQETANRSTVCNKEVTVLQILCVSLEVEWLEQQVIQTRTKRDSGTLYFNDPVWNSLWYIHCSDESSGCQSHMNIAGAWRRGYTGKGVVVSVLDDGIEREHPDLKPNYDRLASYDMNGQDPDPSVNSSNNAANYHGTLCAGIVAAAANNSVCTVGVSFHARIGGIRMLDGDVTDIVEAESLSLRPQYIDIYLAGWGPQDDGATLEGPGPLTRLVLRNGIQTGRRGRGSIFIWASGNGGRRGDHCSCDGYSSSIYTISISSSTQRGSQPDYLERCSSTLAAAYSGGETEEMVTLGPQQSCSKVRSGTSLSSSIAAGVIALTLEANSLLTWRDVQHIIVRTSKAHHLFAPDWHVNGAGFKVSHLYGFGLLDAESMVKEAEHWKQVPSQHECVEEAAIQIIHPGSVLTSVYETTGCSSEALQHVVYVEHVIVRVIITHSHRGDLSITLTSPSGTVSQLLANRPLDDSSEGFQNWEFMTAHCWGEQAAGEWTLKIQDTPSQKRDSTELGVLKTWSLVIYGTAEQPYPVHRERARSAEIPMDGDLTEEYRGPCDPECSDDGCEGPGPQQCVTCLHFFLKFKNNTRLCVSECPKGFWGDRRRCKRCYSSCESCSGSRSDQCTSCQPGHHLTEGTNTCTCVTVPHALSTLSSLYGNRCQRSCAAGFYHDMQDGDCKPCHKACATCAGESEVKGHELNANFFFFYVIKIHNIHLLSAASYPFSIKECDASCLTCVGPSRGNCSSCSSGHSLQEGVCVVNTVCTDGEYQDSNGKCHACDATCLKCTGPQSEDCISCVSSRALDEGRCVLACAKGKYQSGGQCHLCDHTCATCVDAGPANCTSCDTDKFGVERYLYKGLCLDACPETFYHTKDRSCEPCSDHCQLCTSPSHCLQCNSSYYVSDGGCVKLECGEGEVEDPDYDDCMACEEGCRKCVLCKSRLSGRNKDGCYKNCPAKTYAVEEEMTCVPCDDNCVSCDVHECYWCETDLFLSGKTGRCVSVCPDGFYGDEDTNDCEECHSDCVTCSGPEDNDCLSCEEGKLLENEECVSDHETLSYQEFKKEDKYHSYDCHLSCESCFGEDKNQCATCAKGRFLTAQQTCVSKCPAGFFASRLSGLCEACPPGCLQCADAQRCSRCQSTRRAQFFLQDGQCVQECVRSEVDPIACRSCAPGCVSCGRNATHCLSCEESLLLHKHQCVEECPPAHTVRDGECHRCPLVCQECNPLEQCTGCEEYHFLLEGLCVLDCPEGFFEDKERGECLRCHPDCALCDGPNSNDCDACMDREATLHNGACLPACPSHTYRDHMTGDCKDCDASCLMCFGPHAGSCTSCQEGQRLDSHNHCVPSDSKCSIHQYTDQDGECHPCHKYCHRCSAPGKTHCLSCNQRHLLLNGTCVDECPTGYYEDDSGQKCEPCHAACQSCVGKHSHECLTCKAHLFREGKECVQTCQHRYHYGNTASRMCEKCDPSCGECNGGSDDGCLNCAAGLIFLRKEGRCLPSCPQGYHHDAVHKTCEPCHATCRTCSGTSVHSLCVSHACRPSQGSDHSCADCDSSCLECWGPGPSNCTECPPQAILEAGGRCLLCCRHGKEEEEEEVTTQQQDCCNCTETRGTSALSFLLKESSGGVFGGGSRHGGYSSASSASYSGRAGSSGGRFQESQLVDIGERRSGIKDDDDDDEDDEDIVYMGQDGTVYRKFRYGQLGDDNEDELEYDDESYAFR